MRRDSLVQLPEVLVAPPSGAPSPAGARFVMGVDGGATKTLAAVLDLDEPALHCAHGGPSNEDAVGVRAAVQALLAVCQEALASAGISSDQLAAVVLAVAGTDTEALVHHLQDAASPDWIVVNDVVAAWAAATGASPGVGVISGTGSNVLGVGRDGRAWRAGGWGHLLGDEGSGYWIGLQAIRAGLHDRDGSGPQTALGDAATAFFGAPSLEALAAAVYSKPLTKTEIASFATEVARVAQDRDAVARAIYQLGAGELATQVDAVIAHTGLGSTPDVAPFPVGLIGSVFNAGELFVEPLTARIYEISPQAQVSVVDTAPVAGSLLMAARACGRGDALDVATLSDLIEGELAKAA